MMFRFKCSLLFLVSSLLLSSCVLGPQPLRYTPATDLAIPAPARPTNAIYHFIDCQRDVARVLKDNVGEVEDMLDRDLEDLNFSDVNCYVLLDATHLMMNAFYNNMTAVVQDQNYWLSDKAFLPVANSVITIEFWETREKTKLLLYSDIGYFVVMNVTE